MSGLPIMLRRRQLRPPVLSRRIAIPVRPQAPPLLLHRQAGQEVAAYREVREPVEPGPTRLQEWRLEFLHPARAVPAAEEAAVVPVAADLPVAAVAAAGESGSVGCRRGP